MFFGSFSKHQTAANPKKKKSMASVERLTVHHFQISWRTMSGLPLLALVGTFTLGTPTNHARDKESGVTWQQKKV